MTDFCAKGHFIGKGSTCHKCEKNETKKGYMRVWRDENREAINAYTREWMRKKRAPGWKPVEKVEQIFAPSYVWKPEDA